MSKQIGNEVIENVSTAFHLLQDARRRGVLYAVNRTGKTSVEEVAHRIAVWQSADGPGTLDTETVQTSLVHSHLPKLADAGVVEYDRDSGTVELSEAATGLESLLRSAREREPTLFRAAQTSNPERLKEVGQ